MKHPMRILTILMGLSLFFLFNSCSQSTEPKKEKVEYDFAEQVVQLDENTKEGISSMDSSGVITFNVNTDIIKSLEPGKIIACESLENMPYGFLKKVVSVNTVGSQVKVLTTNATLEESFENLSFSETITLTHEDIESIPNFPQGVSLEKSADDGIFVRMINVTFYDDGAGNTVLGSGELTIEPSFELHLDVVDYQLQNFLFINTTAETADLRLSSTANIGDDFTQELEPIPFKPFTIWVGWFPIVIQPKLTIQVGATINATVSFSAGLIQEADIKAGLEYNSGNWSVINDFNKSFTPIAPEVTASMTAYGYTGPKLSLLFYGTAGPYATLRGFLDFQASLSSTPWWELYGGAKVGAGVEVLFLGNSLADYYKEDVIEYRELISQASGSIKGNITGIVKDGATGGLLSAVQVNAWKNNTIVGSGATSSSGEYSFEVDAGVLDSVRFELTGYMPVTYRNVEVVGFNTVHLEPILQIDETYSGIGSLGGQIVNALTGNGVDGLTVNIREGVNNSTGTILQTTTTDAYGYYVYDNLPAGNYTVEASGTGYNNSYFSVICLGGQTTGNQNGTITPVLSSDEIRVILSWGEAPLDLDSHLTGPTPDGNRFHVFYDAKYYNYNYETYANLDRDDVDSYGPETITILKQINGVYRYSVHDYSNREYSYSTALSESNAQVQVYKGSELVNVFYVPGNQEGTLWTVFEMTGEIISPKNIMSYTVLPSDVQKRSTQDETDAYLISKLPRK